MNSDWKLSHREWKPRHINLLSLLNKYKKRVNLFGSINWIGDSIHQSLNITGKLIAKKYCEGKLKRTLKKELKELERVLFERIFYEKNNGLLLLLKWFRFTLHDKLHVIKFKLWKQWW